MTENWFSPTACAQPWAADETVSDARAERFDLAAEFAALPPRVMVLVFGPVPMLQAVQAAWAKTGAPAPAANAETA